MILMLSRSPACASTSFSFSPLLSPTFPSTRAYVRRKRSPTGSQTRFHHGISRCLRKMFTAFDPILPVLLYSAPAFCAFEKMFLIGQDRPFRRCGGGSRRSSDEGKRQAERERTQTTHSPQSQKNHIFYGKVGCFRSVISKSPCRWNCGCRGRVPSELSARRRW